MRGKHLCAPSPDFQSGITPACAGKTCILVGYPGEWEDHPRVCGENLKSFTHSSATVGSPPRVRGKPVFHEMPVRRSGITPACAGKTPRGRDSGVQSKDHPRVCGENAPHLGHTFSLTGSPPRVRGKQGYSDSRLSEERITPACAGKTVFLKQRRERREDHPRVCGENTSEMAYFRG